MPLPAACQRVPSLAATARRGKDGREGCPDHRRPCPHAARLPPPSNRRWNWPAGCNCSGQPHAGHRAAATGHLAVSVSWPSAFNPPVTAAVVDRSPDIDPRKAMNTAVGCADLNNEARATGSTPHTTGTASGNIAGLPLANLLNRCGGADLAGGSSPSPLTARILGRADCSEHSLGAQLLQEGSSCRGRGGGGGLLPTARGRVHRGNPGRERP